MPHTNELHRVLGEISSDVKHILVRQDKQDARLDRMDKRLTVTEKFQWKLMGIATAFPITLSAMGAWLTYK